MREMRQQVSQLPLLSVSLSIVAVAVVLVDGPTDLGPSRVASWTDH